MNRLNLPGSFDGTVTFRTSIVALHGSEPVEAVTSAPVRCQTRLLPPERSKSVVKAPTWWPSKNVVGGFPGPFADVGSNVFCSPIGISTTPPFLLLYPQ